MIKGTNLNIHFFNKHQLTSDLFVSSNNFSRSFGKILDTKTGTVKYPKTTWWQKNFDKNIEYTLPDDTYQWISKATGESFDEQEKAGGAGADGH